MTRSQAFSHPEFPIGALAAAETIKQAYLALVVSLPSSPWWDTMDDIAQLPAS